MNENIIKIAVNGQVGNDTRVGYTWPDAFDPARFSARDEWLRSLYDPREDVRGFAGNRFYALWKNSVGNYYSLIVPNAQDARAGWLMLTIFTGHCIFADGHSVMGAFSALEPMLLSGRPADSAAVAQVAGSLAAKLEADPGRPFNSASRQKGFRTYATQQDVEKFFAWPNQSDYAPFQRIVLVPSGSIGITLPQGFVPINSPIKVSFAVYTTQPGINVSKTYVEQGETLNISYQRPTFLPESRQVVVNGQPCALVAYEGRRLRVLTSEEAGINFRRGVRLKCLDGQKEVPSFWVALDGVQLNKQQGSGLFILPTVRDTYRLTVCSHGYKDANIIVPADQLSRAVVKVRLEKMPAPRRSAGKNRPMGPWVGIAAFVAVLGLLGVCAFFFFGPSEETQPAESPKEEVVTPSDGAAERARVEQRDIAYMKASDEWMESAIQSQRYKDFLSLLKDGNVEVIASQRGTWFPADGVNGYWKTFDNRLSNVDVNFEEERQNLRAAIIYTENGAVIDLKKLAMTSQPRSSADGEPAMERPTQQAEGPRNDNSERLNNERRSNEQTPAPSSSAKKERSEKSSAQKDKGDTTTPKAKGKEKSKSSQASKASETKTHTEGRESSGD